VITTILLAVARSSPGSPPPPGTPRPGPSCWSSPSAPRWPRHGSRTCRSPARIPGRR